MILVFGVFAGLIAGQLRAWYCKRPLLIPDLRAVWSVLVAFVPQWLAFYLPLTRRSISDQLAALALVSSQTLLLLFAWYNRKRPAFWVLGFGLILNLSVILLNGGLMPISPETLAQLALDEPSHNWQTGRRVGESKDRLLPEAQTRLAWLSDRFVLRQWLPYRVAFSLGDIFIALGAFGLLWAAGGPYQTPQKSPHH